MFSDGQEMKMDWVSTEIMKKGEKAAVGHKWRK